MHENKNGLNRRLSPMHVWALAFGCVVGWGSFINPGKKFLPSSGVAGTAIAMVLGALVMVIIAFSYAYMVPKYPKAGGEFTFTKACFGRFPAYLCGWFLVAAYLTNVPMNSTAIGLIVDGLDGTVDILKWGFHYKIAGFDVWAGEVLLASGILILFGILNILGVEKAGIIQTILATLLGSSVLALTIAALISSQATTANMAPIWGFHKAEAFCIADKGSYKLVFIRFHILALSGQLYLSFGKQCLQHLPESIPFFFGYLHKSSQFLFLHWHIHFILYQFTY